MDEEAFVDIFDDENIFLLIKMPPLDSIEEIPAWDDVNVEGDDDKINLAAAVVDSFDVARMMCCVYYVNYCDGKRNTSMKFLMGVCGWIDELFYRLNKFLEYWMIHFIDLCWLP